MNIMTFDTTGNRLSSVKPSSLKITLPVFISVGGVLAEAVQQDGSLDFYEMEKITVLIAPTDYAEYEHERSKSTLFFLAIDPYKIAINLMKQEQTEGKPETVGVILMEPKLAAKCQEIAAKDLAEKNLYFRFNEDQVKNAEYFSVNIEQYARIANYNEDEVNFKRVDLPRYESDIVYVLAGKAAKDAGEVTLEWKGNEAKFMTDILNIIEIDEIHDSRDDIQKFEITHIQWNKRQGATENFVAFTYTEEAAKMIAQGYANAIVRGEEK